MFLSGGGVSAQGSFALTYFLIWNRGDVCTFSYPSDWLEFLIPKQKVLLSACPKFRGHCGAGPSRRRGIKTSSRGWSALGEKQKVLRKYSKGYFFSGSREVVHYASRSPSRKGTSRAL